MLKNVALIIKAADFLSPNVMLYFQGNSRVKTLFGGLLCLKLLTLAFAAFFFFFLKLVDYSDYSVSMNKLFEKYHQHMINTSETVVSFKLLEKNGRELSDNTYSAFALYREYNYIKNEYGVAKITSNETVIPISKCGENFKLNSTEFRNIYKDKDLSNYYCLDPGQIIMINNPFGSSYNFSLMMFFFTFCQHRQDCKNATVLDKELESYNLVFTTTKYYVDNSNYSTPLQAYDSNFVEMGSASFFKKIELNLKNIQHVSDVGLLLSEKRDITKVDYEKIDSFMVPRNDTYKNAKHFLSVTYQFNKQGFMDVYNRNYKRIQNVIAEIGGFVSSLRIVISVVLYGYNQMIFAHFFFKNFGFHCNFPSKKSNFSSNFTNNDNNFSTSLKNLNYNNYINDITNKADNQHNSEQCMNKLSIRNKQFSPQNINSNNPNSNNEDLYQVRVNDTNKNVDKQSINNKTKINNKSSSDVPTENRKVDLNINKKLTKTAKIKIRKLPQKFEVFKNFLCFKTKAVNQTHQIYILARENLIANYLNVENLIKMKNEIDFLKLYTLNETLDESLYNSLIKIIQLNNISSESSYIQTRNKDTNLLTPPDDLKRLNIIEKYLMLS